MKCLEFLDDNLRVNVVHVHVRSDGAFFLAKNRVHYGTIYPENMKRTLRSPLILLLAVSLVMGSGLCSAMAERPASKYSDFHLLDTDGIYTRLSDHKGKVIFLNFFATWCPPCRREMPSIQKLHNKMKGKKFEVICVSVDRGDKNKVMNFIKSGGYTFKVLLDSDGSAADKYSVASIPVTFIIDKKGTIVSKVIGERDWAGDDIIKELTRLAQ